MIQTEIVEKVKGEILEWLEEQYHNKATSAAVAFGMDSEAAQEEYEQEAEVYLALQEVVRGYTHPGVLRPDEMEEG